MPKQAVNFEEQHLTKGEQRKLNALRRSIGEEIGEKAFAEWLSKRQREASRGNYEAQDRNALRIAEALQQLVEENKLHIPRQGYLLKRGRRRVIVLPVEQPEDTSSSTAQPPKLARAALASTGQRTTRGRRRSRKS